MNITITELSQLHFKQVIEIGNLVHGDNYLDLATLEKIYHYSIKQGINASFVALENQRVIGFRLTYAPDQWPMDEWCSTNLWPVEKQNVSYFKSSTLIESARGNGLGGQLLKASISALKKQGAQGGVCHIWQQSPGNAAFKYFTKAGGKTIKIHPDRWLKDCIDFGYSCTLCGSECHCDAVEMFLEF